MEWSLGAEFWSGVLQWSGVDFGVCFAFPKFDSTSLQKYLLFAHKIMYSMGWSLGAEYWSGMESDFGVAKVEWSAVVMCV